MTANRLQAVLDRAVVTHEPPRKSRAPASAPRPKARPTGRTASKARARSQEPGTVLVGAHLPPAYLRQLRLLAAEDGVTSNALIREALDLLFVKKGRERIGRRA